MHRIPATYVQEVVFEWAVKSIDNPAYQRAFYRREKKVIRFAMISGGWIRLMRLALETMDAKVRSGWQIIFQKVFRKIPIRFIRE